MKSYKVICEDKRLEFEDIPDPKDLDEYKELQKRFLEEFKYEINENKVINEEETASFINKLETMSDEELDKIEEELNTPYINAVCRMNGLALMLGVKRDE